VTIWEQVETALTPLNTPMAANRYIVATNAALPDLYIVYQLVSSPPEQHADNVERERSYRVQVTAWSRTGLVGLPNISGAMVAAGFMAGPKRELPYSETTRHFGLVMEFVITE
jgi:hypothetical protein